MVRGTQPIPRPEPAGSVVVEKIVKVVVEPRVVKVIVMPEPAAELPGPARISADHRPIADSVSPERARRVTDAYQATDDEPRKSLVIA